MFLYLDFTMPATSDVNFDEFVEVAKKYNLLSENSNSIKGPADQCWLDISKELKHLISKYAYIIVEENRNDVCGKLFSNEILTGAEKRDSIVKCDDSQSFCSSETFSDNKLNFNIILFAIEWGSLYDKRPQIYKRSDEKSEYRSILYTTSS